MDKKQFKTESKRLLDLMINSIYTNREIFLRELISNASDALDKRHYLSITDDAHRVNKEELKIELTIDKENRRLILTDTGIGIPETIQNKMFDTFQKQDSFIQGVGLGLTICKLIAQSLNGSICLDTEYKKGTRMIFNHPII